jgi:aerobic-type carbon monoxide dehydrogenase small subunit (CoxS/CutS family)
MKLTINNKKYESGPDENVDLLTLLRERLDLTGSKYGCGEGVCGACTVLIDGKPVRSCITPIKGLDNKKITTIEGLGADSGLHSIQQTFLEEDPFQCAYCASGMIMVSVALLEKNPRPTEEEIVDFMNGNICRCGTYPQIVKAIKKASAH